MKKILSSLYLTLCLYRKRRLLTRHKLKQKSFQKLRMRDVKHEVHTFRLTFELLAEKILMALINLTVCYYHVTYAFLSESTLYICLNVKDILLETGAISEV